MSEEKGGGGISLATKSMWKTPENFFPIVVDNFFDDPETLANFGKSLPKHRADRHPGKRSEHLWQIDKELHLAILRKILCCYYDLEYLDISWKFCDLTFHEIPRFSENKNDIRNKGWIHQDQPSDFQLAGLIYLTPNIDPDSGTSLYNAKSNKHHRIYSKDLLYRDGLFDREEHIKSQTKHEENFVEKLRVQNIFNRMVMYDANEFHGANSYWNDDGKDTRLTLVFFIGGIEGTEFPLQRTKHYESIINDRIGKK